MFTLIQSLAQESDTFPGVDRTVLVIESKTEVLNRIGGLLVSDGYRVILTSSAQKGVACLRKTDPDLIICDIHMPDMSGFDILNSVRSDVRSRFTPFLFLTNMTQLKSMNHRERLAISDYVFKPIEPTDLLDTVRSRLEKQPALWAL